VTPVLTSVNGRRAKLLLNTEELVVLGVTLRAAGSSSLDLAGGQSNREIGNESVLSLSRAVGSHNTPTSLLGHADSLDGLGDGADLVHLEEKGVDALGLNTALDALGVSAEHVVTNDLADALSGEGLGRLPVILLEGVLNGDDRVLGAELVVELKHLSLGLLLGAVVGLVLEVQVVHLVLGVELGGGDVHADLDLASVAGGGNGLVDEVQALLVRGDIGGEATLITDVAGILAVLLLDEVLEAVVDLAGHTHGLGEGGGADGEDHELLHGKGVTGVGATVNDVERGNGEDQILVAGELGNVLVEGNALLSGTSLADGHRDGEDGVGTKLALVVSAIKGLHGIVNGDLVDRVHANNAAGNDGVNVVNGLEDRLAKVLGLVAITKLNSLMDTSGGTGGDSGPEHTLVGVDIGLDGRVTAGINDLPGDDLGDGSRGALKELLGQESAGVLRLLSNATVDDFLDLGLKTVLVNVLLNRRHLYTIF